VGAASILYLGVFVTLGAYGLYNYGMSKIPAGQASAFVNLIPVISMLLGWAWLGERLNAAQLAGVAVVFGGVLLSQEWRGADKDDAPGRVVADGGVDDEALSQPLGVMEEAMVPLRRRK
jgi:drug/metabolite transporter (DMT)-like permease